MSSRKQWLGRAAVNATLAVTLVLVPILSPFVGTPTTKVAAIAAAPAAQQPAVARSHAGQRFAEAWKITWNAWPRAGVSSMMTWAGNGLLAGRVT